MAASVGCLWLAVAGCQDCTAKPDATLSGSPTAVRRSEPGDVESTAITVLSPGAEPRSPITVRYGSEPVATRIATITSGVLTANGTPHVTPADVIQVDLVARPIAPGQLEVSIDKLDRTSLAGDKPMPEAPRLVHRPWQLFVGPRGACDAVHFAQPARTEGESALIAEVGAGMKELFVAFPETAIGVGARWTVVQKQSPPGSTATVTKTYELLRRTATQVTLALSGTLAVDGTTEHASGEFHGTVVLGLDPWTPARTTFAKQARIDVDDRGTKLHIEQAGRVEITPSGTPAVAIRASCAELAACCAAIDPDLAGSQRDDCKARVAAGDVEGCSELYSTLDRAVAIASRADRACR